MSNHIRIGGFFSRPDLYPKQRFDKKSIVVPQILSVGQLPEKNDLLEVLKVTEELNGRPRLKDTSFLMDTIASSNNFKRSGKRTEFERQRRLSQIYPNKLFYPIDFLTNLKIPLADDIKTKNLKIPNIGNFLCGNMLNDSIFLQGRSNAEVGVNDLASNIPTFSMIHVYYDKNKKKGLIFTSKSSVPVIRQVYKVVKPTNTSLGGRKTNASISIKKNQLLFSSSTNEGLSDFETFFTYSRNGVKSSPLVPAYEEGDITRTVQIVPITFNTPAEFSDYCKRITNRNSDFYKYEKVISKHTQNFSRINNINSTFLVYDPNYIRDYINTLTFMIIREVLHVSENSNLDNRKFFLFEYILNKLYYAITNENDDFDEYSVLKNRLLQYNQNVARNNRILQDPFLRNRGSLAFSSRNWVDDRSFTLVEQNFKDAYYNLETDSIKTLMKLIYNAAVGMRVIENINIENNENGVPESFIFDRVIEDLP